MNDLLLYILKSTLCISLLYLAFRTVMRKETFFALNRMVLLTIVSCSIIIPLLHLPQSVKPLIQEQIIPQIQSPDIQMQPMQTIENSISVASSETFKEDKPLAYSFGQILLFIYLAGMLITFLIFIHGIISVLLMLRKAQAIKKEGYWLFIIGKEIPAFSFWKMIFISQADYNKHGETILAHEQQHIRLGHFYDLLLMEMAKIVHWFNPVIYWLIQDLKAIHEYQADQHTLTIGIDATKYQILIIQKSVGPQRFALANSFNHCQIKKRITMMNKQKTSKAWRWKVATFLPLLALLLMAFGRGGKSVPLEKQFYVDIKKEANIDVQDTSAQSKETIYLVTEVMPEFPGGEKALRDYIAKSVRYPIAANEKGIQGKVFVNYIVDSEGKVTSPRIVRSVDPFLDAEALRVVQSMPSWIPGKEKGKPVSVSRTMPINFVLSAGPSDFGKEIASTASTNSSSIIGTWRLVSYNYNGGDDLTPVSPNAERIKFITETNFNWVHYAGKDRIVNSSAGGTYVFSGDSYTETIEFGGQGMASYIGKVHIFKVKIVNNKMELSGELADGLKIKEVWERYNPSDKTSMTSPLPSNNDERTVTITGMQPVDNLKQGIAPPPPPPRVQNKGLEIIMDGENIRVENQLISMEELEKMINEIKIKGQFVEIITNSTTNNTVETKIKDLLEKRNVSYKTTWSSKW